jgi:Domain of unknown function (DUF4386)
MIEKSQRNAARVLGVTYPLIFVILTITFVRFYAPQLVWNNMQETARNLYAHEGNFRIYIAAALFYGVGLLAMVTALYIILRPINRGLALFAALCRLVYSLLWFVMLLDLFKVLRLMGSAGPGAALDSLTTMAGLQLASGWDAYYIGLGFYGLGSVFFGYLWLKSKYIPRVLSGWGILASLFVMICAFAYLLYPAFGKIVSVNWYELPIGLFEMITSIWLLARGLRAVGGQGQEVGARA